MAGSEFKWSALNPGYPGPEVLYKHGITPVARLTERLGGTWLAHLDYHQPGSSRTRACTSYEAGRRGVELWAERHADRLRAELAAMHEQWLQKQHWRPRDDSTGAASETRAGHDPGHEKQTPPIPDQGWVGRRTGRRRKSSRHRSPI